MKRAILINAKNQTVEPLSIPRETELETLQNGVEGYIEVGHRFQSGDILFVNEEGLMKQFEYGFVVPGSLAGHYVGNGIIVGPADSDGENLDVLASVEAVRKLVAFTDGKSLYRGTV